jgi:hypothetical protein
MPTSADLQTGVGLLREVVRVKLAAPQKRIVAALAGGAVALAAGPMALPREPATAAAAPTRRMQQTSPAAAEGARTMLHTIDLSGVPAGRVRTFGPATDGDTAGGIASVGPRGTRPFSLLGVTWTDPAARPDATIQVRTRATAGHLWSGWQTLETDEPDAADAGTEPGAGAVRGSTDPLWVGASDGVAMRMLTTPGVATALPQGMRLDMIDPGADPAPRAAAPTAIGTPAARGAAVRLLARPVPAVVSRAGWNADESLNVHDPEYTSDVQTLFVHHTAGTNNYRCGDSAKIIRSIHAYHVRSKHWNDIGYNFLVNKCGTLYEGRRGGVTRPVLGAHTKGFNSHAAGIAVLGDYDGRGVSATVRAVIARVAAYKIGMYGNGTGGRVTMTSAGSNKYKSGTPVRMNRISGHRDAVSTECPGDTLYRQLATIRALAGRPVTGLGISRLTGAIRTGSTFYTRGSITAAWTVRTPTSMLSRFEVLVDGVLVTAVPAGGRTARLHLAPGRHSVRVRAVPLAGASVVSAGWGVFADTTVPAFTTGPAVGLRTGSLNGSVPVMLSWRAADAGGIRSVALTRPGARTFTPTTVRWPTVARPTVATTWGLRATDRAGNTSGAAVTRTAWVVSEAAAARTGSWGLRRSTGYLSGAALLGATAGASLTWSYTGRSAAVAFTRSAGSGKVRLFVDGQYASMIDLRSTVTAHRQAVYARTWNANGAHTVKIEVVGTAGRPAVISDGLVYLR